MKALYKIIPAVAIAVLHCSCGTVSSLPQDNTKPTRPASYTKVIVKDFSHSISDYKVKSKVEMAVKSLPDAIASELAKGGAFSKVSRSGKPDASTLVIGGNIDQYDDGNPALRLMIGFTAGNSNLDATVKYTDGASGKSLGEIKADKNSWALGGALAAAQTADSFIDPIAKKIAKEAALHFSTKATKAME